MAVSAHGADKFSIIVRGTRMDPDTVQMVQNDTVEFLSVNNSNRTVHMDFNGDGTIGFKFTTIESTGNDELLKDDFNGFHVTDENAEVYQILRDGKKVKSNKTWELKAAETILGKNLVIDQNKKNNNFYMWEMDESWNYNWNVGKIYRTNQNRYVT